MSVWFCEVERASVGLNMKKKCTNGFFASVPTDSTHVRCPSWNKNRMKIICTWAENVTLNKKLRYFLLFFRLLSDNHLLSPRFFFLFLYNKFQTKERFARQGINSKKKYIEKESNVWKLMHGKHRFPISFVFITTSLIGKHIRWENCVQHQCQGEIRSDENLYRSLSFLYNFFKGEFHLMKSWVWEKSLHGSRLESRFGRWDDFSRNDSA